MTNSRPVLVASEGAVLVVGGIGGLWLGGSQLLEIPLNRGAGPVVVVVVVVEVLPERLALNKEIKRREDHA